MVFPQCCGYEIIFVGSVYGSDFLGNFGSGSDLITYLLTKEAKGKFLNKTGAKILILKKRFAKPSCEFFVLAIKLIITTGYSADFMLF